MVDNRSGPPFVLSGLEHHDVVFCHPQPFDLAVSGSFDRRIVHFLADDLGVDLWTRWSDVVGL